MNRQKLLSLIFVLGFSMFLPGYADAGSSQQAYLFEMPIEQLMEVEISSAASIHQPRFPRCLYHHG